MGGFGRHIDGDFHKNFRKLNLASKFSSFWFSINVVSVSFTLKAPSRWPRRASRRPSATAPELHHLPKPSFMDRWRLGELRCVRPSPAPPYFHACMPAHATRGFPPPPLLGTHGQRMRGSSRCPSPAFRAPLAPAARHADRGLLTQTPICMAFGPRTPWRFCMGLTDRINR